MSKENVLKIERIKNGTVIDHLPAGTALTVMKVLGIRKNYKNSVSIAMNVKSKVLGMKDVVKVEDRILRDDETDKLSLIAQHATINIVRDYKVVKKSRVSVPKEIVGVLKCGNPTCITGKREPVMPVFSIEKESPIVLRCKFCERVMGAEQIEEQL
ncbi:TPA: aspartate carbamoyltransferase regulatory subunit [archaeon]|nr:aspartate carbamoyltransferase regulatory subunit [Candidatus Naiadarchaeales archaeon SRR2090153.bin461]HIK02562.1 aspartate carbamoyltransferase regulatory subunit [Candidatus Naiadarchaeales archaeon SRR2090159.bin1288]